MARYIGPKSKMRVNSVNRYSDRTKFWLKNYPPGQHGNTRRRKTSEYGVQLKEKRKRNIYGCWKTVS